MAVPVGSLWTDPLPDAQGQPRIDRVRHEFYHTPPGGSKTFVFSVDVMEGVQNLTFGWSFAVGHWQEDAWAMKDGTFSQLKDSIEWDVDGSGGAPSHTPSSPNVPPIEDLVPQEQA